MTEKPTRDELRKRFLEWASSEDPGTSILATRIAPEPKPILLQQGYPDDDGSDRDRWEDNLHSETLHNNDMNRLKQAREAEEKKQRVEEVRRLKGEN